MFIQILTPLRMRNLSRSLTPLILSNSASLKRVAIDLIGVVPDDQGIIISTNRGEPVVAANDGSRSGQAYRNITRRITGEDVPIMDMEETRGFLGKLKSLFSRN